MKKIKFLPLLVMGLLIGAVSCNKDDDNDNKGPVGGLSKTEIQKISSANMAEVMLGQLATTKASDSIVKKFAQMMVTDHQKAQNELDSIANSRNISLLTSLDPQDEAIRSSLNALMGRPFDSSYMASQVSMHMKTKDMFMNYKDSLQDPIIINYITKYLPAIQMHKTKADSIMAALFQAGSDTTGNGNGNGNDTTGTGSPSDTTGTGTPADTTGTGSPSDTTNTDTTNTSGM